MHHKKVIKKSSQSIQKKFKKEKSFPVTGLTGKFLFEVIALLTCKQFF
jgi:hypothetical protein